MYLLLPLNHIIVLTNTVAHYGIGKHLIVVAQDPKAFVRIGKVGALGFLFLPFRYTDPSYKRLKWHFQSPTNSQFTCHICEANDFTLCPTCVLTKGKHCFNNDHYLDEVRDQVPVGKYHAHRSPSGQRNIITV